MKNLYVFLFFWMGTVVFAQKIDGIEQNVSPGGVFENAFDQYGNKYNVADLKVGADSKTDKGEISKSTAICNSGIFNLYFETGSGMETVGDSQEDARRAVVCQVFSDISDFLRSKLKDPTNTQRVNIWVRDIGNIPNVPSGVLGLASAFTVLPSGITSSGFYDNEIWKTIQLGKDSYSNVTYPLLHDSSMLPASTSYYHGVIAFNFSDFVWNTNLSITSPSGYFDLYSVVLHEVTHALGFASAIKADTGSTGQSNLGFQRFFRYDKFLKNSAGNPLLNPINSCSPMYNYYAPSILDSQVSPGGSCLTDYTNCATAVKYVGSFTVPVFTPNCFMEGSSLSHFEDSCFSPHTNGSYFLMGNSTGAGVTRRFLKREEKTVLTDLGYSLNPTFGSTSNLSFVNYADPIINTNMVAGIPDGLDSDGLLTYNVNSGYTIVISGILGNDTNAVSFECLEDLSENGANPTTLSVTSGTVNTNISFTSSLEGMHLLRYVPMNSSGQRGNITYIYVYVNIWANCGTPNPCDLIVNGDFEKTTLPLPNYFNQLNGRLCNWKTSYSSESNEYYNADSSSSAFRVPCNTFGFQGDNLGRKGYVGMLIGNFQNRFYSETIMTKLSSPLLANTTYRVSFNASLAEGASVTKNKIQIYLSKDQMLSSDAGTLPVTNSNMLFTSQYVANYTDWDTITFTFRTGDTAGEEYLYLGGITSASGPPLPITGAPMNPLCPRTPGYNGMSYFYIDNVSLVLVDALLNLPDTVCNNENLSNLSAYVTPAGTNGVFTGPGVVNAGGVYSFNSSTAGVGIHTITYTYNNTSGCSVSISDTIQVTSTAATIPTFNPVQPICSGTALAELPTISTNTVGITGTWSPGLDNTTTTTYTFTPNPGQCASVATLTITVLPPDDPSCGNCLSNLTLSTAEVNSVMVYQFQNWIETNSNYSIASGKDITMKAGDFIYLKSDTHIQGGSLYLAKIQGCENDKFLMNKENVIMVSDNIKMYPNPTNDFITILSGKAILKSITVSSMDGKIVYINNAINKNSCQLNVVNYQNGIYIVAIETVDGKITKEKLIKN